MDAEDDCRPSFGLVPALGVAGTGVLLVLPLVVDVVGSGSPVRAGALLAVVAAAALALVAPWLSLPTRARGALVAVALLVLAVVAVVTTRELGSAWYNVWLVLAIGPGALVGPRLLSPTSATVGVAAATVLAGVVVAIAPHGTGDVWTVVLTTFLAGASTVVLVQLLSTVQELRATRRELARHAVRAERDRFSRDLHDLLGHTLSLVVVKAEVVRRVVRDDPAAAEEHARDIEAIGRRALTEVREAVTGERRTSLAQELTRARAALADAGIDATLDAGPTLLPAPVDEAFAWVVREGVTNVIRHSRARRCVLRVEVLADDARLDLTDDGAGRDRAPRPAGSGITGLRQRLDQVGGELVATDGADGFRLVATAPLTAAR